MEPEDVWVMVNFISKHNIVCLGLKENANHLLYSVLSPDNLLELYALNHYGFSILLGANNPDSAKESPRESPKTPTKDSSTKDLPQIEALKLQNLTLHDPNSNDFNPYVPGTSPRKQNSSRNSIIINDYNASHLKLPDVTLTTSPHTPNAEITFLLLKYASKKAVLKYISKTSKSPNIKLLQQDLRKYKNELNTTVAAAKWTLKQRNKEIKTFIAKKKAQAADIRPRSGSQLKRD